jgi:hypothetical protein
MTTVENESVTPKRRGRPPKSDNKARMAVTSAQTPAPREQAASGHLDFTYHVAMYVPDPRQVGSYFTYDGTVCRETGLHSGVDFDVLLQGLADHIFAQLQVRVKPQSIVIQLIELIPTAAPEQASDLSDSEQELAAGSST